jgi:membrane protein required for colicin V production
MTGIDVIIVLALVVSALISFLRGFYKEFISLIVWVSAIMMALMFSSNFASLLPDSIESPQARLGISVCILFFGTLFVGSLASWLAMRVVAKRRAKKFDRLAGVVFGLMRGVFIVTVLVLLANLTPAIKEELWWRNSAILPGVQELAEALHKQLPDDIATHFTFSSVN